VTDHHHRPRIVQIDPAFTSSIRPHSSREQPS
jgi:hypothetical protein